MPELTPTVAPGRAPPIYSEASPKACNRGRVTAEPSEARHGGGAVVFGNLHAWWAEIVPWLREPVDAWHVYGSAVTVRLTRLGRRTARGTGDWLPVLWASPGPEAGALRLPRGS